MKLIFSFLLSLVLIVFFANFDAVANTKADISKTVTMGVLDNNSRESFEAKGLPWLKQQISDCKVCEIRNITPYNDKGELDFSQIAVVLEQAQSSISFLFITWNEKVGNNNLVLLEALKKAAGQGLIVVGAAGLPKSEEASAPLSKTLLGQVPDSIIIGELGEKDRLFGNSYFGPEMLTAIRPPRDLIGQGVSPALFAVRLAAQFNKKSSSDWMAHIKSKKTANRKIWLSLDDIFGRN